MKITMLTDNTSSWIMPWVEKLKAQINDHEVDHIYSSSDIKGGDIMLILSCEKILKKNHLDMYKSCVVVHPSRLPHGKGWSPLAWQVLEGKNEIPVSLFEAAEEVDSGDVYITDTIYLNGSELNDNMKQEQGDITVRMALDYIRNFPMKGVPQSGESSFYPRRKKEHCYLDPQKSIIENFNLLRISDNERYPARVVIDGSEYIIKIHEA